MEEKVAAIIAALRERYPDALCALHYGKDYELMISVRLSAQCTDARVNQVTPALFARYPTLDAFAEADVAEVEEYVRSCGFFRHKAQDIVAACRMLRDEYGGRVPDTMEQLLRLPSDLRSIAPVSICSSKSLKNPGKAAQHLHPCHHTWTSGASCHTSSLISSAALCLSYPFPPPCFSTPCCLLSACVF